MTVGKMIELLGGKAGVSCGRFHYGSAFGEPSGHADTVEAIRCFLHLQYDILLYIFPALILLTFLFFSVTVKFLWKKALATMAKTSFIQVFLSRRPPHPPQKKKITISEIYGHLGILLQPFIVILLIKLGCVQNL
jgi:hypothetical protein